MRRSIISKKLIVFWLHFLRKFLNLFDKFNTYPHPLKLKTYLFLLQIVLKLPFYGLKNVNYSASKVDIGQKISTIQIIKPLWC